jgi:GH24 family phage-related lysozyme (muramidase)
MIRRRHVTGLCAALLVALLASACSGSSSSPTRVGAYPKKEKITAGIFLDPEAVEGKAGEPTRAVTDAGLALIQGFEGEYRCIPETPEQTHCPYNDSSDYCTIGHGHLIAKEDCANVEAKLKELGFMDGISQAEASDILRDDLAKAQLGLELRLDISSQRLGLSELTDSQYDALVSLIFNIGNTKFANSTLLKKLEARADVSGDVEVAEQFLRWHKSNGEFVQGLLNRREKEVAHFFTGYEVPVMGRSDEDTGIDIRLGETQ